jgi:hypothetical protein
VLEELVDQGGLRVKVLTEDPIRVGDPVQQEGGKTP